MESGIFFSVKLFGVFLVLVICLLHRQGNPVLPGKNFICLSEKGQKEWGGDGEGREGIKVFNV